MDSDNLFRCFEFYSNLAEKQQTKQTNYSFLSFSGHPGWYNSGVKEISARNPSVYRFMAGKSTTNVTLTNSNQRHQIFLAIT